MKRSRLLRRRSDKVLARAQERREVVAFAKERAGHKCEAQDLVPGLACWGPLDGHERRTRARGGNPNDLENIVILCRCHHGWVHAHPEEALVLGLLIASWAP